MEFVVKPDHRVKYAPTASRLRRDFGISLASFHDQQLLVRPRALALFMA